MATGLIELLIHFNSITQVAMYQFNPSNKSFSIIAQHDYTEALKTDDPLVINALEFKETHYYPVSQLSPQQHSDYLAVIPLIAQEQQLVGIIVIVDMPFLSLNEENLENIAALAQYYVDNLTAVKAAQKILAQYPQCDLEFAREFYIMYELSKRNFLPSYLVTIAIKANELSENIVRVLFENQRSIDVHWQTNIDNKVYLFSLLPLSNSNAVEGYINRMKKIIAEKYQLNAETCLIFHFQKISYKNEPATMIQQAIAIIEKNKG